MMEGHEEIESVVQMAKRLCKLVQAAVKLSCYTDCNSKPPLQKQDVRMRYYIVLDQ